MRLFFIFLLTFPLLAGAEEPAAAPSAAASGTKSDVITATRVPDTAGATAPAEPTQNPGAAPAPAEPTRARVVAGKQWYSMSEGKILGLGVGAGFPDGASVTVLFRPWWWLRLNGGLAYNYVGFGIRGGVSLQPVHWVLTPTLSLDLGRYLSGDITKLASTDNPYAQHILQNMTYSFASAQIGVEIGSQQSFAFYLRGGLVSLFGMTASGADVTSYLNAAQTTGQFKVGDLRVTALLPCFSLGFIIFIY